MKKDIYNMELHESFYFTDDGLFITRVPGGWVYEFRTISGMNEDDIRNSTTFVPFNNEFQAELTEDEETDEPDIDYYNMVKSRKARNGI